MFSIAEAFLTRDRASGASRQAGILLQRFLGFENRVALARVQRRGLPLPPILYFLEPGQVAQPRVVIFVELGFPDLVVHA